MNANVNLMIENVIHNSHNKNGITISVNESVKNQENITCAKYVNVCVCVFVCVYVCVYVCVCVCVCLFPSTAKTSPAEQNNKCNAKDQASDIVLRK